MRKAVLTAMVVLVTTLAGPRVAQSGPCGEPGLIGNYFRLDFDPQYLSDIDFTATPNDVVIDAQINFPATGDDFRPPLGYYDRFAVHWTGRLYIDANVAGDITFCLSSDDGSRMVIDGMTVVDNDGQHGAYTEHGTVNLLVGCHDFDVYYFECGGGAQCIAGWDLGSGCTPIPPEVLFTPEPASLVLLVLGGGALLARRRRRRPGRGVATAAALVFALGTVGGTALVGADLQWLDGEDSWWNAACWSPPVVPTAFDNAHIDNGGIALIDADATCSSLYLGQSYYGDVRMDGPTTFTADQEHIGGAGIGTFHLAAAGGTNVANALYVGMGDMGYGTFRHDSGTCVTENLIVGATSLAYGVYEMNGGTLLCGTATVGQTGTGRILQYDGSVSAMDDVRIGDMAGSSGEYTLTGGTLGLDCSLKTVTVHVGDGGTGELNLGDATSTGTILPAPADMVVGGAGTVQGWAEVYWSGRLDNSGRVIADGFGTDRDLGLAQFQSVTNSLDNDPSGPWGWFARRGGRLSLPSFDVLPGPGTYNWGEDPGDSDIDLINSVQMAFKDANVGTIVTISLLATDRAELHTTGYGFIGAWRFDADDADFDHVDLTIRYDHALASQMGLDEADLCIFSSSDGTSWTPLDGTVQTGLRHVTAPGLTEISPYYAVGVPEPATLLLLGLGLAPALLRRRRRTRLS